MVIYRQNRYIALLVGVILVSFSAISLLHPESTTEGKLNKIQGKLNSPPVNPALVLTPKGAELNQNRIRSTIQSELSNTGIHLKQDFQVPQQAEWISRSAIAASSIEKKTAVTEVKTAAIPAPPSKQASNKQQQTAAVTQGSQTVTNKVAATQQHPPIILYFSQTELLPQAKKSKATWNYAVSGEDLLLLQKIVMAEAEGEPYKGKVAVANVVLNRLRSAKFPDTMHKVIYQKRQFSPVANGRLKRVKPSDDCIRAVNAALSGVKEVPDDTYFFLSLKLAQDLTVHHTQTYVKTIGNHTFYK